MPHRKDVCINGHDLTDPANLYDYGTVRKPRRQVQGLRPRASRGKPPQTERGSGSKMRMNLRDALATATECRELAARDPELAWMQQIADAIENDRIILRAWRWVRCR